MNHYEDVREALTPNDGKFHTQKWKQALTPKERGKRADKMVEFVKVRDCGNVLGIDPGPTESAYALIRQDYSILSAGKLSNAALFDVLGSDGRQVAVESLQCYGMPVGRSVFETAYQIGRILRHCEVTGLPVTLYPRQEYARAICGTAKISDAILRQALLLRFGGDGKGEPLALLRGNTDKRSAFGVAVYHADLLRLGRRDGTAGQYGRSARYAPQIGTIGPQDVPKAGGGGNKSKKKER